MKIIQMLTSLAHGDAIGNDTQAIDGILKNKGYTTKIYAEYIQSKIPLGLAKPISQLPELTADDIIIYHASTHTALNVVLPQFNGRKLVIYHNITPPHFFANYNQNFSMAASYAQKEIKNLKNHTDHCIADSDFNKSDLQNMGFTCPIDVSPIIIPFDDYRQQADEGILQRYGSDGITNLLFVGRVAPNKKHEDLIRCFYAYHKYFNPKSRLILCGSYGNEDLYYKRLYDYTVRLGLMDDIIFTGHISFSELLAWYKVSDLFLCMSEHEGFCVPLVEAMFFRLPIVAYNSTAIPYTLGGSGILLKDKEPVETAAMIHAVVNNNALKEKIIKGQSRRLEDFSYDKVSSQFLNILEGFISGGR